MQLWTDQEISEKRVQGYGMSNSSYFPGFAYFKKGALIALSQSSISILVYVSKT
jgi:hypothetical protein